jgi:hypothetical protein
MLQVATQGNQQLAQLPGLLIGNVDDVARQGFEACVKGEVIGVAGCRQSSPMPASRSTPRWLLRRVSGFLARMAS